MFGFLKKPGDTALPEDAAARALLEGAAQAGPVAHPRHAEHTGFGTVSARATIDDDLLEDLETTLLMADCGIDATQ